MTETQLRSKIILYLQQNTNHRKVLSIEKEPPAVPNPDTNILYCWYAVTVETIKGEKAKVWIQLNDGFLFYALKQSGKYIICHQKELKFIF